MFKPGFLPSLSIVNRARILTPYLILLFGVLLLPGCVSKQTYDQQVHHSQQLNLQLDEQTSTISDLRMKLLTTEDNLAACNTELEQAKVAFAAQEQRQAGIYRAREQKQQARIDQLSQSIDNLEQEKTTLEQNIEGCQNSIAELENARKKLALELEREQIARKARIAKMNSTYNELVGNLEQELKRGELTIKQLKNKLSVNLVGQILFASGTAELTDAGKKVLKQVGESLKKISNKRICVEGHTDNVAIKPEKRSVFPSNWELAAARAANVVHFLQDEIGIPGKRLEIRAMGPYQPVADNTTTTGQAQNRRIEIVLVEME